MGFGWAIFMPLVNTVVFTVDLHAESRELDVGMPYPLFAYTGFLFWNLLAASLRAAVTSLTSNTNLVTKVYFPREKFFRSQRSSWRWSIRSSAGWSSRACWSTTGADDASAIFFLPVLLIVQLIFTAAVACCSAMANLFYRDVKYLFEVVIIAWMFASPVAYSASNDVGGLDGRGSSRLNPMTTIIEGYRDVLIRGQLPDRGAGRHGTVARHARCSVGRPGWRSTEPSSGSRRTSSEGAPVIFDHVWKKFRRGERHDSLRDLLPVAASGRREAPARRRARGRPRVLGGQGRVVRGEAGRGTGHHRAERRRQIDDAQAAHAHPPADLGDCEVTGRVGALIEVAAGFHPDLTGRENVYLQGAIMGMKRAEIARHLDEIVDFAGVAAFIDTPVKRYSSGMNARLGFSIAAHLDPEVLIIDEVLSVGDMSVPGALHRSHERVQALRRDDRVRVAQPSGDRRAVRSDAGDQPVGRGARRDAEGHRDVRAVSRSRRRRRRRATCASSRRSSSTPPAARSRTSARAIGSKLVVGYTAVTPYRDLQFGFLVHRSTDGLMVYDESHSPGCGRFAGMYRARGVHDYVRLHRTSHARPISDRVARVSLADPRPRDAAPPAELFAVSETKTLRRGGRPRASWVWRSRCGNGYRPRPRSKKTVTSGRRIGPIGGANRTHPKPGNDRRHL